MIAIDATPLQSEHRFRGVGGYTRHLCQELLAIIPEEVLFYATKSGMDILPENIRTRAQFGSRGHRPAQIYWLYNEVYLRRMLQKARPSLFHATDFNGTIRVRGIPTIATLYDLTNVVSDNASGTSARLSALRWRIYYQKKLPSVDHMIAISQSVKSDAVKTLSIPAERITVIPLGVDCDLFYPARGQGRFSGRAPYILYVGSRDPNKNLEGVLASFALVAGEVPEVRLAIAGRWRPDDLQWLRQRLATDPALKDRVDHVGFVADQDMASLYSNAELFLFPSLAEGFGLPIAEAMACHIPVVTSNRAPLDEIAGDAALLVDPLDVEALATAELSILQSQVLNDTLIEHGIERSALYRWTTVATETVKVYEKLGETGIGLIEGQESHATERDS